MGELEEMSRATEPVPGGRSEVAPRSDAGPVLHVAPTPFFADRGCHIRIQGLLSALDRRGQRSVLLTYPLGSDVEGIETVRIREIPGYHKEEAGPSGFKYLADVLLFFKGWHLARALRPRCIHGHLHEGALIAWAIRCLSFGRRVPVVFDVQGSLSGELEAHGYFRRVPGLRTLFRGLEWLICRLPDHFFCSSAHSAELLVRDFGVRPDRVSVVPDGVDPHDPQDGGAPLDEVARRAELGLPPDVPLVVYSGALLPAKGRDALWEAIREAARRDVRCHFLLIGYPEAPTARFLAENRLEAHCTLLGRVPFRALRSHLRLASVAVEPKSSDAGEASGKLLNYMAAGLPVVCCDTPVGREILGAQGYFVGGGGAALVDGIEKALGDPAEARRRGRGGQAAVARKHSWDAAARTVASVYDALLANGRGDERRLADRTP